MTRSGRNPFAELVTLWVMCRLFFRLKPDLVHLVTIKPVIYGGIAARLAGVPSVVSAISGLGFVFISSDFKACLMRFFVGRLYRLALGKNNLRIIFQNSDDRDALLGLCAAVPEKAVIIRGSGVDLNKYPVLSESDNIPVVTMAARLLRDKGVCEFIEAARLLVNQGVKVRFWLVGDPDPGNPASILPKELEVWRQEAYVELLGFRNDIAEVFATSNLIVLPSYREGLPKVLLEAAACGRAVVTSDVPGCRDAIEPGVTGLLVPARDAEALASTIKQLVEDHVLRQRMGIAGRRLAEREFSIEKVVDAHLAVYQELVHQE